MEAQTSDLPRIAPRPPRGESRPSPAPAPETLLAEIATCYSRLSPFFSSLRATPDLAGHTLLPNALSPFSTAMAWGHCGQLPIGEVLHQLKRRTEWQEASEALRNLYREYKQSSGNALLWAGWNHWNPASPEEPHDGRVVQVVLTEDLAANVDLFKPDRTILSYGPDSLLGRDFLEPPPGCQDSDVLLGGHASGDGTSLAPELAEARLFLFNLWDSVFVPSAAFFQSKKLPTIVDFLKSEFLRYGAGAAQSYLTRDIEIIFPATPDAPPSVANDHEDICSFVCHPNGTQALWESVEEELCRLRSTEKRWGDLRPPQRLQEAWRSLASNPPKALRPLSGTLASSLNLELSEPHGYALLQHLALFERFLGSCYQYILPISFGRHLFVAFISMQKRLSRGELLGWRQIVATLFGGLIAERVSSLLYQQQLDQQESELRRLLSHAMPKAVFQPAQYFAARIFMSTSSSTLARTTDDTRALLFLLAKGQADLAAVSLQGSSDHKAAQIDKRDEPDGDPPLDLFKACDAIESHFAAIKEFLVAGQLDGNCASDRKRILKNIQCEVLPKPHQRPLILVRINRGLLFFHLWNLIDNAFRHGRLVDRAGEKLSKIVIVLGVSDQVVTLTVRNAGAPINQDKASLLNQLLTSPPSTWASEVTSGLIRPSTTFPQEEMEDDHEGCGIARFNLYLAALWRQASMSDHPRGNVKPQPQGTDFEFYLPLETGS